MAHDPVTRRRFLLSATGSILAASRFSRRAGFSTMEQSTSQGGLVSAQPDKVSYSPPLYFLRQPLRDVPTIEPAQWQVRLGGLVQNPLAFLLNELREMPSVVFPTTLVSPEHSPRNSLISQAVWEGVPASYLTEQLSIFPEARYVQLLAADGYRTFLSLEQLARSVLVYKVNGEALSVEQGFPWLITPGLYSYKMPKWIQVIDLTDAVVSGKWEAHGWSAEGRVQTTSTIFTPHHMETVNGKVTISGAAFAGEREIVAVEVSIDDAPWMPAPFKVQGQYCWAEWQIDWTPPATGDYLLKVRATDSAGFTQSDSAADVFPNGSSAIHSVVVRVLGTGEAA